ncbi:hypothetical protein [Parafrigoribacterium soli]|uniref:hypothetical protein n=1 Tax=Parafrigoribacterium soli TaxID=3144663 RepID=UPI0032EFA24E
MGAVRKIVPAAILVALLVIAPGTAASAWGPGYGDSAQLRAWSGGVASVVQGTRCSVAGAAGVQELSKNHVTRLKIKFELRGANDVTSWAPTYRTLGYYYSAKFPDDTRSFYFTSRAGMRVEIGSNYSLWAVVVGERGWRRDFKTRINLGSVGCSTEDYVNEPDVGSGFVEGGA